MATAAVALPPQPPGVGEQSPTLRPARPARSRRQPPPPTARAAPAPAPAAAALAAAVAGGRDAARTWTASLMVLTAAAAALGANPNLATPLFVAFCATALPHRAASFVRRRWGFFLADFCYAVNAFVLGVIVATARHPAHPAAARAERVALALADGPLAGALLAWQCAYGPSADHNVSVWLHTLPGLALFARKWHGGGPAATTPTLAAALTDGFLLPLAFYAAWQLAYFLFVHVMCGRFIVAHRYDTSYRALARRVAAVDNVWNRIVRRGSVPRRLAMYGALQAAFSAAWLVVALAVTSYYPLHVAWQAAKTAVPLWYGAVHAFDRAPRRAAARVLAAGALGGRRGE